MFRSHSVRRTGVAGLAIAALALGACTDDQPELDFASTLDVGVIAPQTGPLEYLGPAQVAAIELALADINEAGGVWGSDVTVRYEDEGDPQAEAATALDSAQALIDAQVEGVIGPLATGATLSVIEPLRDAGIVLVSPASPGIALDEHPARELFLRTHPSDVLQGRVLAQEMVTDQRAKLAIVARDDAYGTGIATLVKEAYASEQREVVAEVSYDPATEDLAAELEGLAEAAPDAVLIISFDEGAQIMTALADAGLDTAAGIGWYLVNGNLDDYSEQLPEGMLTGVKATATADAADLSDFHDRMDEHTSGLVEHAYGAQAYDALVTMALGAVVANTDDPSAIRDAMVEISRDPGTACGTFAECLELIQDGEEINYQGQSSGIDWTDAGDPRQAAIGIYGYAEDNTFSLVGVDVGRR